jgi:RNA polymerase sigma-70 factor (ECF subfamily)
VERGAMDDEAAIVRLRAGEIGALEPLVRRYQSRALRAAFLITRDRARAEDIVQTAFLRVVERAGQLQSPASFGPWFLRSVVNDALKTVSRERWVPLASGDESGWEDMLADPGLSPEELLAGRETRDEVWDALGALPAPQRAAIVARYYLGLTEAELATRQRVPVGTVKWRLHAGRKQLQRLLGVHPERDPGQPKEQTPR